MIEIHPSRTNMYQGEVLAYHAEVSPRGWLISSAPRILAGGLDCSLN